MITDEQLKVYKKNYAKLIAVIGINDVANRICRIKADLDDPEFVEYLVKALYDRGAKRVSVKWYYRPVMQTYYHYTDSKELNRVTPAEAASYKYNYDNHVAELFIESEDPNWLSGPDAQKAIEAIAAHAKVRRPYRDAMEKLEIPWCIAVIPGAKWAKTIFPDLSEEKAIRKLWEKIIICCRLEGDPIKNWRQYNKENKARCNWLNSLKIKTLHYTSKSSGTDLIVGINPHTNYCGGAHTSLGNPPYNPNMPAVECFNTPDKYVTEGIAYSTKPLSYNGGLIDKFFIRFHKGKIVEAKAKKGDDLLKQLIAADKGSCYLGETALVPYDSPVSNTKIIYYKTVLDENASCHLAFGNAIDTTFDQTLRKLSNNDELDKYGVNRSTVHVDFMIGTKDLNIVATTRDNKTVTIFKNGNWAKKL